MSVHDEWLKKVDQLKKSSPGKLNLPPPTLHELKLEYIEVNPGKKMVAKLPFQERFTNPVGLYQGGFLTAAMDEVLGPLSYISAGRPCLTISLNTTFLSPFKKEMGECLVEASVLKLSSNMIFLRAEIKSLDGKLLAFCESHSSIMRDDQMQRS